MLAKFKRKEEKVKTLTPHQQHSKELFEAMSRAKKSKRKAKLKNIGLVENYVGKSLEV
ncbi:hypothetical protein R4Y45_06240 [Holzapfeliella sp. He02]|uniref:Uncharacterized protein n=1 Tax=Holzapfeliella saturejae TaxID=3082953 RepID=A0ABU8SHL1_9LACO